MPFGYSGPVYRHPKITDLSIVHIDHMMNKGRWMCCIESKRALAECEGNQFITWSFINNLIKKWIALLSKEDENSMNLLIWCPTHLCRWYNALCCDGQAAKTRRFAKFRLGAMFSKVNKQKQTASAGKFLIFLHPWSVLYVDHFPICRWTCDVFWTECKQNWFQELI